MKSIISVLSRSVVLLLFAALGLHGRVWAGSSVIIGTYFGNQAVVDTPLTPVTMSTNVQISASFTQPVDDQITAVWVHGTTLGSCPSYSVFIANDDGSGIPDMVSPLGGDSGNMNNGWTKISFLGPVAVTGGISYHMVLTSQGSAGNGTNCFVIDQATTPETQLIPYNQLFDGALFTTNDNGSGFVETDHQPVFILEETANYGNTYAVTLGNTIYGPNAIGEQLQGPVTNTWISKAGAYVQRTNSPAGPLLCELDDLTAPQTFGPVTLATNATANTSFSWLEVNLPGAPILLNAAHQYRLWFSSPGSSSGAYYIVDCPTNPTSGTPYDDLTYDGTFSYAVTSANGGTAWGNHPSSDLAFRFLVSLPPTATPTITHSPTPTGTPTSTATSTITNTPTATATPPAPNIGALNPTNGSTSGGYAVTLFGANLSGPATVTFGGAPVPITNQTASQIVVTAPPGGGALVPIVAIVNSQSSNVVDFAYDPPTLTALLPANGSTLGGYPVTLQGSDFYTTAVVTFGSVGAPVLSVGPSSIVVTAPAGSGTVSVQVDVSGQTSNTSPFTYLPPTGTPTTTPTGTPTLTSTPSDTATATPSSTPTQSSTASPTPSITLTPTVTATFTPTFTRTPTFTPTNTFTVTITPTFSPTPTGSVTSTPTPDQALYLDNNYFDPTKGPLGMDVRVDTAGQVKVMVYNVAGELVVKLADQTLSAGNYRFNWDGTNALGSIVGNAVYFFVVVQPSGNTVKKVIVLK